MAYSVQDMRTVRLLCIRSTKKSLLDILVPSDIWLQACCTMWVIKWQWLLVLQHHNRAVRATPAICRHVFPTMLTQSMHTQTALLTLTKPQPSSQHTRIYTHAHTYIWLGPMIWFYSNSSKKLQSSCNTNLTYRSVCKISAVCASSSPHSFYEPQRISATRQIHKPFINSVERPTLKITTSSKSTWT